MARIWTFGVEEVATNADFTKVNCNHADTVISVVTDVVHGGLRAAQFPTSVTGFISRSFATYTSGKLYSRFYVYFRSFGAVNSYSPIMRHTSTTGSGKVLVEVNPVAQIFGINNRSSGADSRTAGTVVIQAGKWYRIETETIVSTTATGSITMNVYDGDSGTPLDTVSQTGVITTGDNIVGFEYGNRNGVDLGVMVMDDFAVNDDSGTFQTAWCGPGKIEMLVGTATESSQWQGFTGNPLADSTTPNMFSFNELGWNGAVAAPTQNNNTADQNVDDVLTGSVNDNDYQKSTGQSGEFDRLDLSAIQSGDALDGGFTLAMVYTRHGGTGIGTFKLRLWDGPNSVDSAAITIPTSGFTKMKTGEAMPYDLTGKTIADLNSLDVGYVADSGAAEKRISALWVNVEYVPSGIIVVSSTMACPYEVTGTSFGQTAICNMESLQSVSAEAESPHEALGSATAVLQSFTINYEALLSVSQEF